jgi:hypothetical protein
MPNQATPVPMTKKGAPQEIAKGAIDSPLKTNEPENAVPSTLGQGGHTKRFDLAANPNIS